MKKICKKACLPYVSRHQTMDLNSGLLYAEQIEHLICTSIRIIGHRRLLVLYFYPRGKAAQGIFEPQFTVFQATNDFITYEHNGGDGGKWRTAMVGNLGRKWDFLSHCAFYMKEDERRVLRFFKIPDSPMDGISVISHEQQELRNAAAKKRKRKREQKIIDRMRPLHPLGKQVDSWIRTDLLPQYIFYDYQRTKKPIEGYCTACGCTVEITGAKHNLPGVCPACHRSIVFKSRGRQKHIWDRTSAQIIQRISDREIVIRIIKAHRNYNSGAINHYIYESARCFISWDEQKKAKDEWFYNAHDHIAATPWKRGFRPRFSYYQENFESEVYGHLHTRNLPRALSGSPWEYCQIKEFYAASGQMIEVMPYLREYMKQPFIEYFVKLRLFSLVSHVVYGHGYGSYSFGQNYINLHGKSFQSILGVGKEYLPLMQALNISYQQLGLLQGMLRLGYQPNQKILEWCGTQNIKKLQDLLVPLAYTTAHKLMRYVSEQYEACKRSANNFYGRGYIDIASVLSEYRDYLCMCEGLEYDMTNPFVLFPKKLKEAHDALTKLSDKDLSKAYDRQIRQAYPLLEEVYGYRKNGWVIMAPKTAKEITEEGHKLHHCVGNYVRRVATKECIILFLRAEKNVKKPFATIELVDNEVVQARGKNNQSLPAEADQFLSLWEKQLVKAASKKSLVALAMDMEQIAA